VEAGGEKTRLGSPSPEPGHQRYRAVLGMAQTLQHGGTRVTTSAVQHVATLALHSRATGRWVHSRAVPTSSPLELRPNATRCPVSNATSV
jgi:hypothetical protein